MLFLQRGIPRPLFDLGGFSWMTQTGNTRQRGVNSYVVKPVDFEQFTEAVASPSHRRILGYAPVRGAAGPHRTVPGRVQEDGQGMRLR